MESRILSLSEKDPFFESNAAHEIEDAIHEVLQRGKAVSEVKVHFNPDWPAGGKIREEQVQDWLDSIVDLYPEVSGVEFNLKQLELSGYDLAGSVKNRVMHIVIEQYQ